MRQLIRITALVAAVILLSIAPTTSGAEADRKEDVRPVKILGRWNGKHGDEALLKAAPPGGVIADRGAWAGLWKAWRPDEEVPAVDFKQRLVLVFTAGGPNNVGCEPTIDGKGNVRAEAMATLIGGPGFGYLMLAIPREGVRTVNGKPLPGAGGAGAKDEGGAGAAPGAGAGPGAAGAEPGAAGAEPGAAGAEPGAAGAAAPVVEITDVAAKAGVFDAATDRQPLVLRSEKEAAEHFSREELAKLTRQVNFTRQVVLVFAWHGSGQDRMEFTVAESFPEQVRFGVRRGRTKDLREHVRVYALRSNVKWSAR